MFRRFFPRFFLSPLIRSLSCIETLHIHNFSITRVTVLPANQRNIFANFKMALNPKESGEFIVTHAKYLEVQKIGVKNLAKQVGTLSCIWLNIL